MKTKVLQILKPKAKAMGFNEKELEDVAASIAGNLTEESTDEQIGLEVDKFIPFLKVSQSMATRVINASKKPNEPAPGSPTPKDKDDEENEPAWFKSYREKTEAELTSLRNQSVVKDRKALFVSKLEGLPEKIKQSKLKDFDRISFKDDEDFNTYLTDQESSITEIKQELSDKGLESMIPPAGGKSKTEEDDFINKMKELNKSEN